MAFEVETGSGSHTATSLCSVAYADTHHAKNKRTAAAWAALSTNTKEFRLETATEIIARDSIFAGYPVKVVGNTSGKQRLPFPRYDLCDRDGNLIESNIVPEDIQRATAQLAGELELKNLDTEPTRGILSVGAGRNAVAVTFDPLREARVLVRSVVSFLKPFLANGGSSAFGKATR
jgi:hypothetical protein